ncbi:MAG: HDIG domain-containing protein [Isosphaeraceae bacterium]|nr:HDIG domain-containing protein [Isosphaeraceae bacterium]
MSLGKRRPKLSRISIRQAGPTSIQEDRLARRRDRLARLVVVGLAIVATAALMNGLGPPFPYRLGQRPNRDIRVNVPQFLWLDPIKTSSERQRAADEVPPSMLNDPAPIRDLAERVDDLVRAVAKAKRIGDLPSNLRTTWKLTPAVFDDIHEAADTPDRLEILRGAVRKAFQPLIDNGILGPGSLPRQEEASRSFSIRTLEQSPADARTASLDRVLRERIAKPDGPVRVEFVECFGNPELGDALFSLVADKLAGTPTLTYESDLTAANRESARRAVADVFVPYKRGDVLVEQDKEIRDEHLLLLRKEHETAVASIGLDGKIRRALSGAVLVAALFGLVAIYTIRHEPRIASDIRRVAIVCGLVVATMGLVRVLAPQPWDAELVPVAITAMILAIAYNPNFALMTTFGLSILTTLATGGGLGYLVILMGGTAAGVLTLREVRTRTKLIKVGATAALGYAVLTWAVGLWQDQPLGLIGSDSLWRAGWGLMAGFFLGGSLPFVETAFGIVTGISLLELGDITHPLLQELVRRAPGTHNHSITVGTIAEAAAERIGANALLVRVGAYFHDIGKMLKPHYFVENQVGGANRHANLAPAMSTLIIIGHVKDGVDLGRRHHLPEPIIDLIEQHHGTTLVEYFYHEAHKRNGQNPDASNVLESSFRYPGPKPRSKEAAILMVADCVESASRTLSEPTPARIEGLVRDLIEKRLRDGQFDECGLTLREISEIRESLIKSIIGIYHVRVRYPEPRSEQRTA